MRFVSIALALTALLTGPPVALAQQTPEPGTPLAPLDPTLPTAPPATPPTTPPTNPPTTPPTGPPTEPPTTPPVNGGTQAPGHGANNPTAVGVCEVRGQVLAPSDFGIQAGLPLADMSAVRLADGRIRLYMFGQGRGIVSAVSTGPDGLSFIPEAGVRLPDGRGMPRAVVLPDGRIRLFHTSGDGIKSAVSPDGLTFVEEAGFRISKEQAGFVGTTVSATSGATVISLADGRYRMYFSDLPRPGDAPGGHLVKSAVSTDMLTWTMEAGVRLGPGAPVLSASAEHPFALPNPDGSVTLYYGKFSGPGLGVAEGMYISTSVDGLTFETETLGVSFGNDPDAIRLVDGTLMVYYGLFDPAIGGTINAAACPDPAVPATPTPATGAPGVTTDTPAATPVMPPADMPADGPAAVPARVRPIRVR